MNLLAGWVVADGCLQLADLATPLTTPLTIPLTEPISPLLSSGQTITVGVRPEMAVLVTDEASVSTGLHLRGTVESVEADYARRTQLAYMRTGQITYAAVIGLDTTLFLDSEIEVVFPYEQLTFFDGATTMRLG